MNLETKIIEITKNYRITNLMGLEDRNNNNCYWPRLGKLRFFSKLRNEHGYHFLYEIQTLSNQIHYGIVQCFLLRDKICTLRGHPNIFNHRYTFMLESTIHCIYSYWNRVGLALNTYLKKPKNIKNTYFSSVVNQLLVDYPSLEKNHNYLWITKIKDSLNELNRNEFAHNNSLIMQSFLDFNSHNSPLEDLLQKSDILLSHNRFIVDEVFKLVALLEELDNFETDQVII